MPVSYTHLDVYKRQTYYVFKMDKVHQDATYLPIDLTCEKISVRDNRTVPVSYTHLDVYKRQILDNEAHVNDIDLLTTLEGYVH